MKLYSFLLSGLLLNAQQAVTFTILPNQTTDFSVSASTGGSDSDTVTYSGTIEASLVIDETTLTASEIEFTGGQMNLSDTNLAFNTSVPFGIFSIPVAVTYSGTGVSGYWDTIITPSTLSAGGVITNTDHTLTLNQGEVSVVATGSFINESELIDLSTDPQVTPLDGTNTITLTEINADLWNRTIEATLTSVRNVNRTEPVSTSGQTVTITETGTVTSQGQFSLPTDFGTWAAAQGLTSPSLTDENVAGIPYGLLHALDLGITATCLPMEMNGTSLEITLPPNGLRAEITPYYAADLSGWAPLATTYWVDGATAFDLGQSGVKKLNFPPSPTGRGFIQLHRE